MASGFAGTESGFVDETRNGENDDVEGKDVTAECPCDVGDNVDVILSDEHFKTAQTFSHHVVFGTWLFHMVDGTGCVWYVVILHGGRVVFGTWLFYMVDGLCLVCGYYTRWTGCVWYVVIQQGGRVVFGMWLFNKVDGLCLVCGYLQAGRVVFGMWLFNKVDGLCLVCGYYTRWTGCVWYVVIQQG